MFFFKFGDYVTFSLIVKNKQSIFFKNEILFDDKLSDFQKKIITQSEYHKIFKERIENMETMFKE